MGTEIRSDDTDADEVGRDLAGTLSTRMVEIIDGFPGSDRQRAAMARMLARNLDTYADEVERS